jgi:rSAM/selenodomain-associated transferase 1
METCCILFVKEPRPGSVKTRLTPPLSPQQAATLYAAFVADTAATVGRSAAALKVVAFTPTAARDSISRLLEKPDDFQFWPQEEGDLGERLNAALRKSFEIGCGRAVIVGSDSPSLPPASIDDGLKRLVESDVVIGPSTDGGFYLVGRRGGDDMFEGVEWSTGRVLEQTLKRLGRRSLSLLPPWYDVDTAAEAAFLKIHLAAFHRAGIQTAPRTRAVLEQLELPPPS